jgi:hypothetical protein
VGDVHAEDAAQCTDPADDDEHGVASDVARTGNAGAGACSVLYRPRRAELSRRAPARGRPTPAAAAGIQLQQRPATPGTANSRLTSQRAGRHLGAGLGPGACHALGALEQVDDLVSPSTTAPTCRRAAPARSGSASGTAPPVARSTPRLASRACGQARLQRRRPWPRPQPASSTRAPSASGSAGPSARSAAARRGEERCIAPGAQGVGQPAAATPASHSQAGAVAPRARLDSGKPRPPARRQGRCTRLAAQRTPATGQHPGRCHGSPACAGRGEAAQASAQASSAGKGLALAGTRRGVAQAAHVVAGDLVRVGHEVAAALAARRHREHAVVDELHQAPGARHAEQRLQALGAWICSR